MADDTRLGGHMAQQENQNKDKHFSPRTTNIMLGTSVAILIVSVLIRYLTTAPQEGVLVLMGVGVFLFLLVAFDQPD
jgi:hypothetical protein